MKVLLDDDGIVKQFAHISDEGVVQIYNEEDVTAILERNKQLSNQSGPVRWAEGEEDSMHMLGSVSPLKMFQLIKQGIWFDDKKLRRWFRDTENIYWSIRNHK